MKSVADLVRHWDRLGRPTPESAPHRSTATRRARALLARAARDNRVTFEVSSESDKDCLYALADIAKTASESEKRLARRVLASASWRDDPFGELVDLLESVGRRDENLTRPMDEASDEGPSQVAGESDSSDSFEALRSRTVSVFARIETAPGEAREQAESLFRDLQEQDQPVGSADERVAIFGELALVVGTACRVLSRREEARSWFSRAEAYFASASNASVDLARLGYQRLCLAAEERHFDEVLRSAPSLAAEFRELGLPEWALKCRFAEGNALRETSRVNEAIFMFERVCDEAAKSNNPRLLGMGLNNLAQCHRVAGNLSAALACAQQGFPILQQTRNRVNLMKLRWCLGDIFREQGNVPEAMASYRIAFCEAHDMEMRWDVAALHLVLADMLLDAGLDQQAAQEVRAALPIIDEEQMVPEGYAALGLLRESLRRRQIDRTALREVHGYFPAG